MIQFAPRRPDRTGDRQPSPAKRQFAGPRHRAAELRGRGCRHGGLVLSAARRGSTPSVIAQLEAQFGFDPRPPLEALRQDDLGLCAVRFRAKATSATSPSSTLILGEKIRVSDPARPVSDTDLLRISIPAGNSARRQGRVRPSTSGRAESSSCLCIPGFPLCHHADACLFAGGSFFDWSPFARPRLGKTGRISPGPERILDHSAPHPAAERDGAVRPSPRPRSAKRTRSRRDPQAIM